MEEVDLRKEKKKLEMLGVEPRASYMRSKRSPTELHPLPSEQLHRLVLLVLKGLCLCNKVMLVEWEALQSPRGMLFTGS